MRACGVPESEIEAHQQRLDSDAVLLWADHLDVWQVFVALGSQWRAIVLPAGGVWWQGVDYGVVPGVLRMMGIERRRWTELFDDLRVMEAAAVAARNEKAK